MAKTLCKIGGIMLVLVGVVGFFMPALLGMHLTTIHNVIHLATGALAIYFGFAGTERAASLYAIIFGATYGLVALLGFVAPNVLAAILGHANAESVTAADLMPDNVVHVLLTLAFLGVGLASRKKG